jgi:hypothetical protein
MLSLEGMNETMIFPTSFDVYDVMWACLGFIIILYKCTPFIGAFAKLRRATTSFIMSVHPFAWNNSLPTKWICMKFDT